MILWVDVETTGLEPRSGSLLEVGLILTDDQLLEWGRYNIALQPPVNYRSTTKASTLEMHDRSGLWFDCENFGIPREHAEQRLARWLREHVEQPVMAGNTVGFDRSWLKAHMPVFHSLFHYRSIDVSSLKELNSRWGFAPAWEGDRKIHRSLLDLEDSIAELRHYQTALGIGAGSLH